jgi:tRNA(Ile)-lysidine synthase
MENSRNSPSSNLLANALADCLARQAQAGQSLAVAYSGGMDSTVMLHVAKQVASMLGMHLSAIHVHHGLSAHADAWARHCQQACTSLGVGLQVTKVRINQHSGAGLEAAARKARLDVLLGHPMDWILMAHHADDQAETVLHNLLRGTGPRGAAGIPERRGRVLRPLLNLSRQALFEYAQAHRLTWIEDESNEDRRYTRNYLRHEILPAIKHRFPQAVEQLSAAARRFGDVQSLLDELALNDLGEDGFVFPVPLSLLRSLSEQRAKNVVRALISGQQVQLPDERRLSEFVRQLLTAASDRHPRLELATYVLLVKGKMLHFRKQEDAE